LAKISTLAEMLKPRYQTTVRNCSFILFSSSKVVYINGENTDVALLCKSTRNVAHSCVMNSDSWLEASVLELIHCESKNMALWFEA